MKRSFNIYYLLLSILVITYYLIPAKGEARHRRLITVSAQTATPTPSLTVSPSPSATGKSIRDNLRERVEEKLDKLTNKPRAFVGKITQISNSSLTLETKSGVKQVKLVKDIVIVQIEDQKSKTIKESDLAVGDFAVAMGYFESKDTLSAKRILTTNKDPLEIRKPVYGVVQSYKDSSFIVKHPAKNDTWTVKTSSKTKTTIKVDGKIEKSDIDSIAVGDRIVAVGKSVKNGVYTIAAELIHVIPGVAHGLNSPALPKATKPASPAGGSPTPKPTANPSE